MEGPNPDPGVDDDRDSHSDDGDSSSDEAAVGPTPKERLSPTGLTKNMVSRGVDFHGVTIVVNLDFRVRGEAYTPASAALRVGFEPEKPFL